MEERIRAIFHGANGMITKEQLNDMLEFMVLASKTQELKPEWEDVIVKAFDKVMHMEEQMKYLPEIPMIQIEGIVTKFIKYARKEHGKETRF